MVSNYDLFRGLNQILRSLQELETKIDNMPSLMSEALKEKIKGLSFKAADFTQSLVMLSVAEQRTSEALKGLTEPIAADEVASMTHRARAVESMYLNGLHRRDMVVKERRGRKTFFILKGEYRDQGQTVDS